VLAGVAFDTHFTGDAFLVESDAGEARHLNLQQLILGSKDDYAETYHYTTCFNGSPAELLVIELGNGKGGLSGALVGYLAAPSPSQRRKAGSTEASFSEPSLSMGCCRRLRGGSEGCVSVATRLEEVLSGATVDTEQ
jgi:hypothetical protein